MKKIFITLFITILLSNIVSAQMEMPENKAAADSFELNYNKSNFEAVFAGFAPDMQQALPVGQTTEFLKGLQEHAGRIVKREFTKYEQGYAVYKTTFERAVFAVNISVNNQSKINGLFVKPFVEKALATMERNITPMSLPFDGEWTVVWGGDTKELNYHVESEAQKNAFDIVITNEQGNSYKTDGKANEDYYAFGKELKAPCDGEVVLVVDGIKDNKPGVLNPVYVPGNTVVIKTVNNEFLFFAHFKQHSIVVKQGQKVKKGALLGLCGNSGNSSEPHVHFHLQNAEEMNDAVGIKCYFEALQVNGQLKKDYSPIQKDKINGSK